ncbi:MAG: hypothetical protein QW841_01660 [Candidatus Aenigmatarchaeota archaeon]
MVSFIREKKFNKGDVSLAAIIALFLGILIFVVMVGYAFKIPGLGGQYLGYVYNALSFALSTIWDFLGKLIAPFIKEVQKATIWAFLTVGITLPAVISIKYLLTHGVTLTWKQAVRNLFKISFWKDVGSAVKSSISHWWSNVKAAFSSGIWKGIKYVGKSLITNAWKIATGFVVGMCVEIGVTFALDYLSYSLVGKGFAQAINDILPGGGVYQIGAVSISVGHGVQSAISGAASGAVIGAMFGGPIGAVVGAAIGGLVGLFTGLFFH